MASATSLRSFSATPGGDALTRVVWAWARTSMGAFWRRSSSSCPRTTDTSPASTVVATRASSSG
eukprot:5518197-Lingulodinium_polyedra.AAC.1